MDMAAALKWVKPDIARFGGDPANVTLYGQAAGSVAIALLAASPPTRELFHCAMDQIDGYALGGRLQALADGEKAGVAAAE
jgi:para-nitrobenzyl esterase